MEVRDRQVNDIGLVGDHALIQAGKVGRRDGLDSQIGEDPGPGAFVGGEPKVLVQQERNWGLGFRERLSAWNRSKVRYRLTYSVLPSFPRESSPVMTT